MLTLKHYQQTALEYLEQFLQNCRYRTVQEAYDASLMAQDRSQEPYHDIFSGVPCVCLRVPTGGGKTLMAAHAIAPAGKAMLDSDAPVALWLTPSETIRNQTLEALANKQHPYRQALEHYYGDRVRVCDLDSLQTVSTTELRSKCIVVVATIQSFNVTDTAKRNVYAFNESLAPCFDGLIPAQMDRLEKVSEEDLQNQTYLTQRDLGRVKYSIANWFSLHNPIVIVDEAHNNKTQCFFNTLGRLNPSCIIELTATPIAGNNVLYHVSALELKAEQMIKLPIVLSEHPTGWQDCLHDAILTRERLQLEAQKETDYIRPIVLIQAEPKGGGEAIVEVVKQYMLEQENIPENQIAIATGKQKELDGINLFDPACPIRYVITVEALKEGWDCSFAYVLASLQNMRSAKDVEQLLGRVLRMPYAKERAQEDLNKAYAHVVAATTSEAAMLLKDRMVQNMGFDRLETASLIVSVPPTQSTFTFSSKAPTTNAGDVATVPNGYINVPVVPDTQNWPEEVKKNIAVKPTTQGVTLVINGSIDSKTLEQTKALITQQVTPKQATEVTKQFEDFNAQRQAAQATSLLGLSFVGIPQLCLNLDGYLEVVEKETLANLGDWNPLNYPIQLAGFKIQEMAKTFVIDISDQERVTWEQTQEKQLDLIHVQSLVSEQDLVKWLDIQTRRYDLAQPQLRAYLLKMISHLQSERKFTLTQLVRAKFQLVKAISAELDRLKTLAMQRGFQASLLEMTVPDETQSIQFFFCFKPGLYPARNLYQGSYVFKKHFYPQIHDLQEKTPAGQVAEEFTCARAIDAHPLLKQWVRNIEKQPKFSFWLPTATDYFYPDFVAELTDGRVLVVEYKGAPYKSNDDSKEKQQVGMQWEKASQGKCLFLFAVKEDELGRDVARQLEDKLKG